MVSIYTKPLSRLVTSDLKELLDESAVENLRLEFKAQAPDKENTLKKVSSFANTYGGFIVVGAVADGNGRIHDLPGVDKQPSYKQQVVQWCFDSANPPLTVEVSDPIGTPSQNGKFCFVISVPESDIAPHFLNGRKGIWIRTDEFSGRYEAQLANEVELRHLFDRRRLVLERRATLLVRARRRLDTYLARTHTDAGGNRTKLGPFLEFVVVPRFPAQQLCEQAQLAKLIQKNWVPWRQTMFTDPGSQIIAQHESAAVFNAARGGTSESLFEVDFWGLLFYGCRLDSYAGGYDGILLAEFVGLVLLFIDHAGRMLRDMGHFGSVVIETTLTSILGVPWFYHTPRLGMLKKVGSELDDDISFSIETTANALFERPDGLAMDIAQRVLFGVNAPELVDTVEKLEPLILLGYQYNMRSPPTTLRT